ncbi:MAG: aminotransferase class V-fold PLP-dependent enzyme [Gammaproteobacteria bacterium]|nr:aminotransferase class V-fold PLP-dependent enzyme [Gammaproteobacteria bacterium]
MSSKTSRRTFMGRFSGGMALGALAGFSEAALSLPKTQLGIGKTQDDERYWQWVTNEFLTQPNVAHMNTGTRGVSPRSVVKAQFEAIRAYDSDYISYAKYVMNLDARTAIREKLAEFVGCKNNEIAITNNTTEGMAYGTLGIDFKAGDEVIYTNHDHSSGAQPINLCAARYGIKPVVVDLSDPKFHPPKDAATVLEAIEKAITSRTRLISFCHVNYTDGCVLPVKEICALARSKGILTLVDGAHPPGMMDLDINDLGCDMYAGAGHKWLLASMLTGFFYVNEAVQDRVWPIIYSGPVTGLNMYGEPVSDSTSNNRAKTAARYEMHGSLNFASFASLDAALDFHNELTPAAIEARDRYMAQRTREGLKKIRGVSVHVSEDPAMSCGLVSFKIRGVKPTEVNDLLWERHRIYIRNVTHAEIDWDVNRVSLHIMVHSGQVDTLVGAVEEIARERRA